MSKKKDKRTRELKRRRRKASRGTHRMYGERKRVNHSKVPRRGWPFPGPKYPDLEDVLRLTGLMK